MRGPRIRSFVVSCVIVPFSSRLNRLLTNVNVLLRLLYCALFRCPRNTGAEMGVSARGIAARRDG